MQMCSSLHFYKRKISSAVSNNLCSVQWLICAKGTRPEINLERLGGPGGSICIYTFAYMIYQYIFVVYFCISLISSHLSLVVVVRAKLDGAKQNEPKWVTAPIANLQAGLHFDQN